MIHGMQVGAWCFENYKEFFHDFHVITPTLRYHDTNTYNEALGHVSVCDYVSDLEKELKALPKDTILLGYSLGALLAQKLAQKGYGSMLILIAPAVPYGIYSFSIPLLIASFMTSFRWKFWEKPIKQNRWVERNLLFNLTPPSQVKAIHEKLGYESGRAMFEVGLWFLDSQKTTRIDFEKITCPIFIGVGKHDRVTLSSSAKALHKHYPQSHFKEYDNHAHWIIAERGWEMVARDIQTFIKENI